MKRLIILCAVLLLVQSGLVVLTQVSHRTAGPQPGKGPLFKPTAAEVNGFLLEDAEGHKLQLVKAKDRWQLPDLASFPADTGRVQGLVDRLMGLQHGWPEATSPDAAKRFKVASDRFERKLTLKNNNTDLGVIYFGSSPGLRKIYIRVDGEQEIETIAMASHELEVQADGWIDTRVLHLKPEQVLGVALPGLQLERQKDGLQPVDLAADEELVQDRRDGLVKRITGLTITSVLGKENKPEYGLENPVLRYSLKLDDGNSIEYVFGQPPKAEAKEAAGQVAAPPSYVLKVGGHEQLFRVDGWQVDEIRQVNRSALVRPKGQVQAGSGQASSPANPTPSPQ